MAANQKPVYATEHVAHGGRLFRPGERMDDQTPEHSLKGALEGGVATDVKSRADEAKASEIARRQDVEHRIANRSEKRDHAERQRASEGIPRVIQLPDGTYARVDEG